MRSGAITEGICASSGKISKTEEEDREARKRELNKGAIFPKDNIAGDTKTMRDKIITPIPLSSFAIAKETTKS